MNIYIYIYYIYTLPGRKYFDRLTDRVLAGIDRSNNFVFQTTLPSSPTPPESKVLCTTMFIDPADPMWEQNLLGQKPHPPTTEK